MSLLCYSILKSQCLTILRPTTHTHLLLCTVSDVVKFHFKHCRRAPRGVRGFQKSKISCQIRFWQFKGLIFSQNWKSTKKAKNDLKKTLFWPEFGSLLSFSWMLALQTNRFFFSKKFLTPWVSLAAHSQWRYMPPDDFFLYSQNVRCKESKILG